MSVLKLEIFVWQHLLIVYVTGQNSVLLVADSDWYFYNGPDYEKKIVCYGKYLGNTRNIHLPPNYKLDMDSFTP